MLGLNNQMTLILQQLLETHPALTYHKVEETESLQFEYNPDACTRVVRDYLGKVDKKRNRVADGLRKVCSTSCKNLIIKKIIHLQARIRIISFT